MVDCTPQGSAHAGGGSGRLYISRLSTCWRSKWRAVHLKAQHMLGVAVVGCTSLGSAHAEGGSIWGGLSRWTPQLAAKLSATSLAQKCTSGTLMAGMVAQAKLLNGFVHSQLAQPHPCQSPLAGQSLMRKSASCSPSGGSQMCWVRPQPVATTLSSRSKSFHLPSLLP